MQHDTTLALAFDGGATRTRAGLYDAAGSLLMECLGSATNPVAVGEDACVRELLRMASQLLEACPGRPHMLCAALAGAADATLCERLAAPLRAALRLNDVLVTDDLTPILEANAGSAPAVLVLAGTGSAVCAQDGQGHCLRLGGRGPIIGDAGSAYHIAVAGLRAAARAFDGLEAESPLLAALLAATGQVSLTHLARWTAAATKAGIADLARTVLDCATHDALALACAREQAACLAAQTLAAARLLHLPTQSTVFLHGGVFEHSSLFRQLFEQVLRLESPPMHVVAARLKGHRAVYAYLSRRSH